MRWMLIASSCPKLCDQILEIGWLKFEDPVMFFTMQTQHLAIHIEDVVQNCQRESIMAQPRSLDLTSFSNHPVVAATLVMEHMNRKTRNL